MRRLTFSPRRPHPGRSASGASVAFTLVEMLVAMAVLTVILLAVTSMTDSATKVTKSSEQRLDADEQARVFLDRIQTDLTMMPRRADLDYQFLKVAGTGGAGGNDRMFFYSSAPGYSGGVLGKIYGNNGDQFMEQRSSVGIVGYMIDERDTQNFGQHQARRFGDANLWLNYKNIPSMVAMAPASITNGKYDPSAATTIFGGYSGFIGTGTSTPSWGTGSTLSTTDKLWPLLASGVFRIEFCYLLKDGTYSVKPIAAKDSNGLILNNYFGTTDPEKGSTAQGAGARWWNETFHRAFICTFSDPAAGNAIWKPYGLGDVNGIVISIAVLDSQSRTVLNAINPTARWAELMKLLPDPKVDATTGAMKKGSLNTGSITAGTPTSTQLPAQSWSQNLSNSTSFQSSIVPLTVLSQVRVYQRTIYLR